MVLADEEGDHAAAVAPGRPMFRQGADSRALATVRREIGRPMHGAGLASKHPGSRMVR